MEFKFFCVCLTISYFAISRDVVRLFPVFFSFSVKRREMDMERERERERRGACVWPSARFRNTAFTRQVTFISLYYIVEKAAKARPWHDRCQSGLNQYYFTSQKKRWLCQCVIDWGGVESMGPGESCFTLQLGRAPNVVET